MCTTLPRVLVTVMGIEKVVPEWRDIEVFAQLLPRSSTAERMNPYTSFWTGVRPGDGPEEFHLVLLDNGRTDVLADEVGRQALHCIRCSACLNVCPVYSRTGGQAYGSIYPGPIGAILTPQLRGLDQAPTAAVGLVAVRRLLRGLPGARSTSRRVLVHLRGRVVREVEGKGRGEKAVMQAVARVFGSRRRLRDGAEARAPRPRAARRPGRRRARPGRVDAGARPARDPGAELPRVVGEPRARRSDAGTGAAVPATARRPPPGPTGRAT